MREVPLVKGEYYHVFNRGVEKRNIFTDQADRNRFLLSVTAFNSIEPIGSIFEQSFARKKKEFGRPASKLVKVVAYCLNPNHFHFILQQSNEGGISEFMKRLGGGYTKYFNARNRRSGVLFQGKFKAIHISTNDYLLHLSAYVNLNDRVHGFTQGRSLSSWTDYTGKTSNSFVFPQIILDQFTNNREYQSFAESSLQDIRERKGLFQELKRTLLE